MGSPASLHSSGTLESFAANCPGVCVGVCVGVAGSLPPGVDPPSPLDSWDRQATLSGG